MKKNLFQLFNTFIFILNLVSLISLLCWSIYGIWELIYSDQILFWQVFTSLVAILIFNFLLVSGIAGIYKRNLKLSDIFNESEYSRNYNEGDIVFNQGEHETVMYLVVKGKVELVANDITIEIVESGGIFGEMSIIDNLPHSAMARCIADSKLITINEKRFYALLQELPFFAKEIMRAMSKRLRRAREAES